MTLSFCLVVWCAVGNATTPVISAGIDTYSRAETLDRFVVASDRSVLAAVISDGHNTSVALGVLPLGVRLWRVSVEGGWLYAHAPVPQRGSRANWIARAGIELTRRWSVGWTHVSNSGLNAEQNPSIDALSVGWAFR